MFAYIYSSKHIVAMNVYTQFEIGQVLTAYEDLT